MCPFQCDLRHFRNIQFRDPEAGKHQYTKNLLLVIRQANIDAFWERSEQNTVNNNRNNIKRLVTIANDNYGISNPLPEMGPHKLKDNWGMSLAVTLLLGKSLDKGVYGGPTM